MRERGTENGDRVGCLFDTGDGLDRYKEALKLELKMTQE